MPFLSIPALDPTVLPRAGFCSAFYWAARGSCWLISMAWGHSGRSPTMLVDQVLLPFFIIYKLVEIPWGTSLVTGLHLAIMQSEITTHRAWQFSQFSIHPIIHTPPSHLISLSVKMLWKTDLAEVKVNSIHSSPSFTKLVTSLKKAISLVRHDFTFINPRWLLLITFLSFILWKWCPGEFASSLFHGSWWYCLDSSSLALLEDRSDIYSLPGIRNLLPVATTLQRWLKVALQWDQPAPLLLGVSHHIPWTSVCQCCLNVPKLDSPPPKISRSHSRL